MISLYGRRIRLILEMEGAQYVRGVGEGGAGGRSPLHFSRRGA